MQALFLGNPDQQVFGIYHPPTTASRRGVVLCYPFGQEYLRAHRSFRQLANLLAKSGLSVLRFDYFGTGDSAGEATDFSCQQAAMDVVAGVEELCDIAELDSVSLIGLRLGAVHLLDALSKMPDQQMIDQVILWDPVTHGPSYLTEMQDNASVISSADGGEHESIDASQTFGINGFPITPSLHGELSGIDLCQNIKQLDLPVRIVVSHQRDEYDKLRQSLSALTEVEFVQVTSPGNWNDLDAFGGILMHSEIVKQIVDWAAAKSPDLVQVDESR